jgi:hypothetical protein
VLNLKLKETENKLEADWELSCGRKKGRETEEEDF